VAGVVWTTNVERRPNDFGIPRDDFDSFEVIGKPLVDDIRLDVSDETPRR